MKRIWDKKFRFFFFCKFVDIVKKNLSFFLTNKNLLLIMRFFILKNTNKFFKPLRNTTYKKTNSFSTIHSPYTFFTTFHYTFIISKCPNDFTSFLSAFSDRFNLVPLLLSIISFDSPHIAYTGCSKNLFAAGTLL